MKIQTPRFTTAEFSTSSSVDSQGTLTFGTDTDVDIEGSFISEGPAFNDGAEI